MASPARPLAILNPRSGGGRGGRTAGEVRAILERSLGPIDLEVTRAPGHAIDLAKSAAGQGRELVIAVGGDGTFHEVVNGVLDAGGSAAVGYVAQGTGGDFRRTLGIAHRLDAYVAAIASGRTRRLDAGRLRYRAPDGTPRTRWFVNIVSAGLGGLVDAYVARTSKAAGGRAAYFWASARALVRCPRARLRCRVTLGADVQERWIDSLMLAVCNGRYFGAGMHVAPMAEPDDGRLEVVSLDAPNKLAFALSSRRIYEGKHLASAGAHHFACEAISVDLEDDRARDAFLLDVDGEPLGGLPFEVHLARGALLMRA
jgi:YegS/Rv2252/BmrU family lipid kinase